MNALKTIRTTFFLLALCMTVVTIFEVTASRAQTSTSQSDGVVIAMLLSVVHDKPAEEASKAMNAIRGRIQKQSGFIDDMLLASTFPGNKPSHVYISRWRTVEDWQALSGDQEFLNLLETGGKFVSWSAAEVFETVK